jgi:hypothetical protein
MGRQILLGVVLALGTLLTTGRASADDVGIVVREFATTKYADARRALEDAMADEGLSAPSVNPFGAMLARTAPDLGHPADLYRDAEIFSFCSATVSARLAIEDVRHIALCPMTIALYTLPARPGTVFLAYREPPLNSPAGALARDLLRKIAARTAADLGIRP